MTRARHPGLWLLQATNDYAASRCCLSNGLFPGFVLAQQSVEKLLKAHLLIAGKPTKVSKAKLPDVSQSHDLLAFAHEVEAATPALALTTNHADLLTRLSRRFEAKYPDSRTSFISASTEELRELDWLVFLLFTTVNLPPERKAHIGLYPVFWHLVDALQAERPESAWIRRDNAAFHAHWPDIRACIEPLFRPGTGDETHS